MGADCFTLQDYFQMSSAFIDMKARIRKPVDTETWRMEAQPFFSQAYHLYGPKDCFRLLIPNWYQNRFLRHSTAAPHPRAWFVYAASYHRIFIHELWMVTAEYLLFEGDTHE